MKKYLIVFVLFLTATHPLSAQYKLSGLVKDAGKQKPIEKAEIFLHETKKLYYTNKKGVFETDQLKKGKYHITIFSLQYKSVDRIVEVYGNKNLVFELEPLVKHLEEVHVSQKQDKIFSIRRLRPVESTAVYAGKKNEVVVLDKIVGNIAANNARQIYSQVVGLNIYENDDAGLQLNIGGRGLDPNRTSNFNTRQNGYDISADVLGYPESYYTPPAEGLREIQVIRGAASLQYGTQFGGLINFKMRTPDPHKKIALVTRQSLGSFGFFSSFNSLSGTVGKTGYYTYFNYKRGDGFRDNSNFDSRNFYGYVQHQFSEQTKLSFEYTYFNYLAKQAGGLTDKQLESDIRFSNRDRNWFKVDWKLFSLQFTHKFTPKTELSVNMFALDAYRKALGFRGNPLAITQNPITAVDEKDKNGNYFTTRDLMIGKFRNFGTELRLLTRYQILGKRAVFLIGSKYYQARNISEQGAGTNTAKADFHFENEIFPNYPHQSSFVFPNQNIAFFGENILNITDKLSITPGFRFEYIKTQSEGDYLHILFDNAGNPLAGGRKKLEDNRVFSRNLLLLGLGLSYKPSNALEAYGNFSQNYRSVTFNDIRTVSPSFIVEPDITDEKGFTVDVGIRGKWQDYLSYDLNGFGLLYDNRIGIILKDSGPNKGNRSRGNIGKALIGGMESFANFNVLSLIGVSTEKYILNLYANTALTFSKYVESEENNVKEKEVEFVPRWNLKTGIRTGYKNLSGSIQYGYISKQYTDATNAEIPLDEGDSRYGAVGPIPSYGVVDLSLSYEYKKWKIETGISNLMNKHYFTRRATGYPGPGIIPSATRNGYVTIQFKF